MHTTKDEGGAQRPDCEGTDTSEDGAVQEFADGGPPPTLARRGIYGFVGIGLVGLGFWIVPFQAARGELGKTALGMALAVIGILIVVRAVRGRSVKAIQRILRLIEMIS